MLKREAKKKKKVNHAGVQETKKEWETATWWTAHPWKAEHGLGGWTMPAHRSDRPTVDSPPRSTTLLRTRDNTYTHTRTGIAINHAESVRVPVTEELTANDVRVQADHLEIFGIVTFAQHRRAALTIVYPRRRVAYDVNLKTLYKIQALIQSSLTYQFFFFFNKITI